MTTWIEGTELGLKPLRESNDILGDHQALDAAWERDGYLFFRDVLDKDAVANLRAIYLEELAKFGVVDDAGHYNGGDLTPVPKFPRGIQGLFDRSAWREFAGNPEINEFVTGMLGERPFWVPVVGYRVSAPGDPLEKDRFVQVHQDGFFNKGIPFRNCWVPLVDMDADTGGLAVAEGYHKTDYHSRSAPPAYPISPDDIPLDGWRLSDYHPGDLLILHLDVPHTGVSNISSDRFRLSLDIRMLPSSTDLPAIGKVVSIDSSQVTLDDLGGDRRRFVIDENTYCRVLGPDRMPPSDIPKHFKAGDEVIVAGDDEGRALVLRPASY